MGEPKQLLTYNGKSMVRQMAETALEVTGTVIVVTGAGAQEVEAELSDLKVIITRNEGWSEGIASSIRMGLSGLLHAAPSVEGAIFMVCDQPFVSVPLLKEIVLKKEEDEHKVIACGYGNTLGTPALFGKELFAELLRLKGDAGAKKVIMENADSVLAVQFPLGNLDLDTREDYKALLKKS